MPVSASAATRPTDGTTGNDAYHTIITDNAAGGITFQAAPQRTVCGNVLSGNTGGDSVGTCRDLVDPAAHATGAPMPEPIDVIARDGVVPVVVLDDAASAAPLGAALAAGGLHTIEITLRTGAGLAAIRALAGGDLLVGAGTVLSAAQVDAAVAAGARFVVSPGFAAPVVARCREHGIAVIPGVATPTDIHLAVDAGLDVVKFFPAGQLGGPATLAALAGPFRSVRFIPTGGVNTGNLPAYLANRAVLAVGGTWMVAPSLLAARNWDEVTRLTAEAVAAAAAVRAVGGGSR